MIDLVIKAVASITVLVALLWQFWRDEGDE